MEIDNYRKEDLSEAKTEDLGRNSTQLLNSVMIFHSEDGQTLLPIGSHGESYIATIEAIVNDCNIQKATQAIISNRGAPGVDGITTEEIKEAMKVLWPQIKLQILAGEYKPQPVKRVDIPKPDKKGTRKLGIPTVLDRIIQQAIHQELVKVFEPTFSDNSYGFRPNRSAKQAILKVQEFIEQGCEWVVDIDLERFFDNMNHDLLMRGVKRRVEDRKILRLIRSYLTSGIMEDGLIKPTEEGAPQGGPLSPLLSNIMLDDLDKELEKRGLRFARYADDCNIYVKSELAGQRVMESVTRFLSKKLKLRVNQEKSAVDNPRNRKFLGFTFVQGKKNFTCCRSIKTASHVSETR
jgi:RNA-directed DNA polymerase